MIQVFVLNVKMLNVLIQELKLCFFASLNLWVLIFRSIVLKVIIRTVRQFFIHHLPMLIWDDGRGAAV